MHALRDLLEASETREACKQARMGAARMKCTSVAFSPGLGDRESHKGAAEGQSVWSKAGHRAERHRDSAGPGCYVGGCWSTPSLKANQPESL